MKRFMCVRIAAICCIYQGKRTTQILEKKMRFITQLPQAHANICALLCYRILYLVQGSNSKEEPWISIRLEVKDFVLRFRYLRKRDELYILVFCLYNLFFNMPSSNLLCVVSYQLSDRTNFLCMLSMTLNIIWKLICFYNYMHTSFIFFRKFIIVTLAHLFSFVIAKL